MSRVSVFSRYAMEYRVRKIDGSQVGLNNQQDFVK